MVGSIDAPLRRVVFDWLAAQRLEHGDVLPWDVLKAGAVVNGQRVHVIGPQGIFKPRQFLLPLSITTSPNTRYPDRGDPKTSALFYSYRGTDPSHPDNVALRTSMVERVPLVYFFGIEEGSYLAIYPVFIVGDNPGALTFTVQADDAWTVAAVEPEGRRIAEESAEPRRAYVTATVRRRLHQVAFRARVVRAYHERCALCRLRHRELLDAAHITPDIDPEGEPLVSNGLALCKLHHSAFDRFFFAVRPDYHVEVRASILAEEDGPMLVVGLQQIHGQRIDVPSLASQRPDVDRLARRYEEFRRVS